MRYIHAAAAVPVAIAALLIVPMGTPSAHADHEGYRRCVGRMSAGLRLKDPDPNSGYLAGLIEQDLNRGVSPAAEAQKVAQMGFEPRYANGLVQCVMQTNP
jgi:hypothetical protein